MKLQVIMLTLLCLPRDATLSLTRLQNQGFSQFLVFMCHLNLFKVSHALIVVAKNVVNMLIVKCC